jgi:hypothetical protein
MRATSVRILAGGLIDAGGRGLAGGSDETSSTLDDTGFGPGGGASRAGGGHGGTGGYTGGGTTYGDRRAPLTAGSGGGAYQTFSSGCPGGGVVWIEASDRIVVDGTVSADGVSSTLDGRGGGGAGGGILLWSPGGFTGTGFLRARGGNGYSGICGSGGGGRIAVWNGPLKRSEYGPLITGSTNAVILAGLRQSLHSFSGTVDVATGTTLPGTPGTATFVTFPKATVLWIQ